MLRRLLFALAAVLVLALGVLAGLRYRPARLALEPRPPLTRADPQQTNVVLVIGCTTRAEHTTPYGAPTHVTPFLERVAQEGTRFSNMISQAPWTRPAVTAILTSRHASAIGLTEPSGKLNRRSLPEAVETLAERMRASGRATFGLAANPNASSAFGFAQGFDQYWDGVNPWHGPGAHKVSGLVAVEHSLEMLDQHEQNGGGPFYLQLILIDAHQPDESTFLDEARFAEPGLPMRVARYRARVHRLDQSIETLWEGLEARGHTQENTLFVFVGDHGEGLRFPWHHGYAHGAFLYRSALGVPWIMRGPGVARGHVVDGLGTQLDVVPTILGLLGLPPNGEATGSDWSLQASGASPRTTREFAFAETWFSRTERAAVYTDTRHCQVDFRARQTAATQARLREKNGGEAASYNPWFKTSCFDLERDPSSEHPIEDPELMARVAPFHREQLALRRVFGEAQEGRVDERLEKQLEALGYTQ